MKTKIVHWDNLNKQYFLHEIYRVQQGATNAAQQKRKLQILKMLMDISLTERQRYCFSQRVLEQRKQREIAAELGIHESVVSRHIARAKEKLFTQYTQYTQYTQLTKE